METSCLVSQPLLNKTNEVVNCLHPVIITNPNLKDLLYQHGNYTYDGVLHRQNPRVRRSMSSYFPKSYFRPRNLKVEDLGRYYVTDFSSGQTFPMYIAVPCGHCKICEASKVDSFAHRCELETQCYSHLPYFLTLTYNDNNLPVDGLSVRDAQLFLKRLRSRLSYAGFNDHFRYVCVGEYGHNTHRCHYHLILWNLYPVRGLRFFQIRQIVRDSWNKGFVYLSVVSPFYRVRGSGHMLSKPENCFKYVAKYISKSCDVPKGMNGLFNNTSRRKGGIGAPFLERHKDYIRKVGFSKFSYLDCFSGKVKPVVMSRYVLSKLYPSISQSVPLELRNAIRRISKASPFLDPGLIKTLCTHKAFKNMFWPLLRRDDLSSSMCAFYDGGLKSPVVKAFLYHLLWHDIKILIKYKDFDYERCRLLDELRNLVTSKMFMTKKIHYLVPLSNKRKYYDELAKQREVF